MSNVGRRVDRRIIEAKPVLMAVFKQEPEAVFYERQLQVRFERHFYHWIIGKALHELVSEGKINTQLLPLLGETKLRFYWSTALRSWRRKANVIADLVRRYSTPDFAIAVGAHGETMFDAALPRVGFIPKARDVRHYGERVTKHKKNLDRVFQKDDILYGAEIKNTLDYISRDEFDEKMAICQDLALRPLFICRAMPKSYAWNVIQAGGIALIFGWQLYPHGSKSMADEIPSKLGLPTDSPRVIGDGLLKRLVDTHEKIVQGISPYRPPQLYRPIENEAPIEDEDDFDNAGDEWNRSDD